VSIKRDEERNRLLEEILAELKLLNHSLGGAFLPWLPKIHGELARLEEFNARLLKALDLMLEIADMRSERP